MQLKMLPARIAVLYLLLLLISLSASAINTNQVTLAWDPSPDDFINGYRLYYGPISGTNYTGYVDTTNLTVTVSNLENGMTYFFVVTAYVTNEDSTLLESDPSNEVRFNSPPALGAPIITMTDEEIWTRVNIPPHVTTFTFTDDDTELSSIIISGVSSNTTLLPDLGISITGTSSNRSMTLTPASNEVGKATIIVSASDGTNSSSVALVLTVKPSLTANSFTTPKVFGGFPAQITLQASDEGSNITYQLVSTSLYGGLTLVSNVVTYTPTTNINGFDSFTYVVYDSIATSGLATVTIPVAFNYISDPPTGVVPDIISASGGTVVTISGDGLCNNGDITNVTLCGIPVRSIVSQSVTQVVVIAESASNNLTGDVRVYSTLYGETVASNAISYSKTTFDLSSSLNPNYYGQTITVFAVAVINNVIPSGIVVFRTATTLLGTASFDLEGVATLEAWNLLPGVHTVYAEYAGDEYTSGYTNSIVQTVYPLNQSPLTFNPASPQTYGTTNLLSAIGGSGTGAFYYQVVNGPGQIVNGNQLVMTSGVGTVEVKAVRDGDVVFAATEVSRLVVAAKADQTITFSPIPNQVVTNIVPLTASAASGLPVTYSVLSGPATLINGGTLVFTNAGEVAVAARQDGNDNYLPAMPVTNRFMVSRIAAEITLSGLSATFDGAAKVVTATTIPEGLSVQITYDGALTAPSNAGFYTVIGTIQDSAYQGAATNTLVVQKATAQIVWTNLTHVYDGAGKSATALTTPENLGVELFYDGLHSLPTNVGNYEVVGIITNGNYCGMATNSLEITKAVAEIVMHDLSQIYDGSGKSVQVVTAPAGLSHEIRYNGMPILPTNAGLYPVVVNIHDTNYSGSITNILVIHKAIAGISISNLSQTYDGSPKPVEILTAPQNLMTTVSYAGLSGAPVESGTYAIVCVVNDTNYEGTNHATLTINRASSSINWPNPVSIVYPTALDASQLNATANVPGTFAYAPTNGTILFAGSNQTLSVIFTPSNTNYISSSKAVLISVLKGTATVSLSNLAQVYDGFAKPAVITTIPAGLVTSTLYNGSTNLPVNAGTYEVVSVINDMNYKGSATNTLEIQKASASVTISNLNAIYDGTAKAVIVTTSPTGLATTVTYNSANTPPIVAGQYTVVASVDEANFKGAATNTLIITKGTPLITWNTPAGITYPTALSSAQLNASANVAGTFAYTPTTGTVLNAGSNQMLSVIFTPSNTNYTPSSNTVSISVLKGTASISFSNLVQTYDGTAKPVSVVTIPNGLTSAITYGNSSDAPTNAGAYALIGRITDGNYDGVTTNLLSILQAASRLQLTSSANPSTNGQNVNFTASISNTGAIATGTVVLWDDGIALSTNTLNATGMVHFAVSNASQGAHIFTAIYSGNQNLQGSSMTVTQIVNRFNREPVLMADTNKTLVNVPLRFAISLILSNDVDPDGDTLALINLPTNTVMNGSLTLLSNVLLYVPAPNFVGTDSFVYTVSDGFGGTNSTTVTLIVESICTITAVPTGMSLSVYGSPGTVLLLQRSTDLRVWQTIATITIPAGGRDTFTDHSLPSDRAFYRVLKQ